jgi:hypothetical protein
MAPADFYILTSADRTKNLCLLENLIRKMLYLAGMSKKKGVLVFIPILIFILAVAALFSQQIFKTSNTVNQTVLKNTQNQNDLSTNKGNVLNLSNQGLEKLPADILTKSNLEELDISNNKLTGALPAEIRNLQRLRVLDASDNLMTGVPAEVGQLQNLEILDLSNNKLTRLPYELGNLKKLKQLNLAGNNFAKQDLEIIKKGLSPNVVVITE